MTPGAGLGLGLGPTATYVLVYAIGVVVGAMVAWSVMNYRIENSSGIATRLANETVVQAAFIRATGEICDEATCREIEARANDRLAEYDIPEVAWQYDPGNTTEN